MNTWAITDIHGCALTFRALLRRIQFSREDTLFLLGDYIDRGPRSKEVLDVIMELREADYTVECLLGNHDWVMLHALDEPYTQEARNWKSRFGGQETLRSFRCNSEQEVDAKYIDLLQSMDYYREYQDLILVHAGLNLTIANPWDDQEAMLWVRYDDRELDTTWLEGRTIVHGHTPQPRRAIYDQLEQRAQVPLVSIDNGCVYDRPGMNHLCALNLDNMQLIFEPNVD